MPELHEPGRIESGDGGVLGHPVQLVDRDPEAHEELEHLGGDRGRAGAGPATPPQTDPFEQRPKDQRIPEPVQQTGAQGVIAPVGHFLPADDPGQLHPEPEPDSFEGGGVAALDQDAGVHLLPDPGNREEEGRLDLPQVLLDGLDRLGKVEHGPAMGEGPGREDSLGDMAERQIGEDLVVGPGLPVTGDPTVDHDHLLGAVDDSWRW